MNKRLIIIFLIILVLVLFFIYFKRNYIFIGNQTPVRHINAKEAKEKINNKSYDYIVDVRTEDEWNEAHLPLKNVINIPIGILVSALPNRIPNKEAKILFVCKRGIRAEAANVIANKLGYTNIEFLDRSYSSLL